MSAALKTSNQMSLWDIHNATSSLELASGRWLCVAPDGRIIGLSGQEVVRASLSARQARALKVGARHLWPAFNHLIAQCKPAVVFGEQVASKAVEPWVDLVHADLEALGYAFGCVPFPSAGVGAPHIRDRLYWVADSGSAGSLPSAHAGIYRGEEGPRSRDGESERPSSIGGLAKSHGLRLESTPIAELHDAERDAESCGGFERLGNSIEQSRERIAGSILGAQAQKHGEGFAVDGCLSVRPEHAGAGMASTSQPGPTNSFWASADWLGCRDAKFRPVEPGTFPLAHGATSRVGRLRAYGNAINAKAAQVFIESFMGAEVANG